MRVLAVGCHPDDLEIAAGGTLMRCVQRGDEVTMCHVANGNMGHVSISPDELRDIRGAEAREGGRILGAARVVSLDAGDLTVESGNDAQTKALTRLIRDVNPDLIITHDPNDYMRDHVETFKLVFDASFSATVPHYGTGAFTGLFAPIYHMDTLAGVNFIPEEYVDISDQIEGKIEALEAHVSQIKWMRDHDHIDFADMTRVLSRLRGYQCGAAYAEGFRLCKVYPRMVTRRLLP